MQGTVEKLKPNHLIFLADFKDGRGETKVTLSKTRSQQDGPLKGEHFSNHSSAIKAETT